MSGKRERRRAGQAGVVGAGDALETLVNQFADPLVFLRELVQNSLDAASTRVDVDLDYDGDGGVASMTIVDNGEGMNEGIIDRYLLTLFSSTKENDLTKIGKFGVGFVSIFAMKPDLVVLETGQAGESWRILFHADRSYEKLRLQEPTEGTCIVLHKRMPESEFVELRSRAADTVRYWCKYAEADILVDGESVSEAFALDAALTVSYAEPGTEILIGFAPPRRTYDSERISLIGREAGTALRPLVGFYNRGLTLVEAGEPPDPGARSTEFLAGLSVRVKSRFLEHTLTRDNVRQDENYVKVLKLLRQQAETALRARLCEHLQAVAAHHCERGPAPGGPGLELSLLYARLPSMRLHETAENLPVLPTVSGTPTSVKRVRVRRSPTGTVLRATTSSPVTELLRERDVPVLMNDGAVIAHLDAITGAPIDTHDANQAFVTARPVETSTAHDVYLEKVLALLERAKVKVSRVALGDLAYPGSCVPRDLCLRQEDAFGLTRPDHDDQPTWLGGARDLVLNVSHRLVQHALALAAHNLPLAAQITAQAVCAVEGTDGERTVALTDTAMKWH